MSYNNYLSKINALNGASIEELDKEVESTYHRLKEKKNKSEAEESAIKIAISIIDSFRGAAPVSTINFTELEGYILWKDLFESLTTIENTPFLSSSKGNRYRQIIERYNSFKDQT
ncbi:MULTISPECIES: hypothetical protein [Sphingobacterium]|uniref:hypothetical protein n=1 Tax=Sphingobacterium TaxID=28453 RepID=UPI000EC1CE3A|nr:MULTISPECIES: hypothetical protein [Sphingobacterium]HAF36717.1 hypothetical protein [Sphingobacterium sp.]